MDARHHRVRFPVSYSWVPTKEEMEMLELYSSIWSEEDYKAHKYYTDFNDERCNAIQLLARTRLHLDSSIYLIHDVDKKFGQVYFPPVAGYKSGIKPTGLADDPVAERRKRLGKPNKGAESSQRERLACGSAGAQANILQMLTDAKARADAEQAAKKAALDAAHTAACAKVDAKNAAILEAAQKAWRQAGAPLSMAEKLRGVVKPPQPSWEEWQKTIVYLPHPTREAVQHKEELAPFLERYRNHWCFPTKAQQKAQAEADLAASKKKPTGGMLMAGVWQHWEVAFLDPFIQWRMEMVPY
jgi:hypothetical protein